MSTRRTPHSPERVAQLAAQGTAIEAVVAAWINPGPHPHWHKYRQRDVRESMPVLALALDRLAKERS